jgi:glutathione S-transferase
MIELYQYRPKFGVPNLSPFCLKLETWLKLSSLDYVVNYLDDPRSAPLGKLPYIKDGDFQLSDSTCIIEYLSQHYKVDLDSHLSPEQLAIAHSCQVMIEEHVYWVLVYHRWLGEGWHELKTNVFSSLPPVVRHIVPVLVQRQLKRDLHGQGIGRHSIEQINKFAIQDLESLSIILGDKPYLMGDKISSVDASLYAILCELLQSTLSTPLQSIAEQYPNLVAYQLRVGCLYFPEYYPVSSGL